MGIYSCALNQLGRHKKKVTVVWVPGHKGHSDSEKAMNWPRKMLVDCIRGSNTVLKQISRSKQGKVLKKVDKYTKSETRQTFQRRLAQTKSRSIKRTQKDC